MNLPSSLGVNKNQVERDNRLTRWRLQREAQLLLPEERVAFCMRRMKASHVDVCYLPNHQSAHYKGLITCGSVWTCPLCAARISEYRRTELEKAITRCLAQGGAVYLATYTVSHHEYDALSDLLQAFLAARKRVKQGRAAQRLQQQFKTLGTVSVREVTWSKKHGWHPHCHELVFFAQEIDAEVYAQTMRSHWQKCAEHEGLSMNEHGFQLDKTYGAVHDYLAKFGREPLGNPWGVAEELTKAHLKRGRGVEHLTPFGMLAQIAQGNDELRSLFLEYARWFKGKRQLVWSPKLRSYLLKEDEELSDQAIAQQAEQDEILLGQLNRLQWSLILKHDARGKLLEVARSGEWSKVLHFLEALNRNNTHKTLLLGKLTGSVSITCIPILHFHDSSEKDPKPLDNKVRMLYNPVPNLIDHWHTPL